MNKLSLQKQLAIKPLKRMIDKAKAQEELAKDKDKQKEISQWHRS